jgi:hypothetical protein
VSGDGHGADSFVSERRKIHLCIERQSIVDVRQLTVKL